MSGSKSEIRKKAEQLLKTGKLIFLYSENNLLHALFEENKRKSIKCTLPMDNKHPECSCSDSSTWCVHVTAAAMHYLKCNDFSNTALHKKAKYSGLKGSSLNNIKPDINIKSAYLKLWVENEPPHAPSKWEKCRITVKLYWKRKEYAGNIKNLRQLNFGESVGSGLTITEFPPQHRQIIRFLALHAEADGFRVEMAAESAAEFFHTLAGFEHAYINPPSPSDSHSAKLSASGYNRPVLTNFFVHKSFAEVVLTCSKKGSRYQVQPALLADSKLIPAKGFRMLTGRSGCWLGINLDYWWIPGTIDMTWMRSFLLAKPADLSQKEIEKLLLECHQNSINVIQSNLKDSLPTRHCIPIYDALFSEDGIFELTISFAYGDKVFLPGGPNTSGNEQHTWKRDRKPEQRYESELLMFGFQRTTTNTFTLKTTESAGLFIDKIATEWYKEKRDVLFSANFAEITNGQYGIPELKLSCTIQKEKESIVELSYSISTPYSKNAATWKELQKLIKKGDRYLFKENTIIGRISDKLTDFLTATDDFTQVSKKNNSLLTIPKSSLIYWGQAFEKLTSILPTQAEKLQAEVTPKESTPHIESNTPAKKKPEYKNLFKGELRSYQREGVEWIEKMMENNLNAILADEMGLGKTVQTIALLCRAKERSPQSPASLILCPSSLVENWYMEFRKFAPDLDVIMLHGANRKNKYKKIDSSDIIITSYTVAGRDIDVLKQHTFFYLVLDEAQHIKNPSTLNAHTAKAIEATHKLVLTGTPLENTPQELWSIFDFIHPKMLGSLNSFKNRYSGIHTNESMQQDLAMRTAPFILRRKKHDVEPDIPSKIVQTLYCEMSPKQREIYEDFREEGRSRFDKLIKSGKSSRFDLLTNLLRLRQICCHPALLKESGLNIPDLPSAKTELLKELLMESIDSGHKVLLFSQFTSFLSIIKKWLSDNDIPFEYLDGSTKGRLDKVNKFNNSPDIPLFLLSLKAGGVGLNLTSADRVIIYDPWWNPAIEAQATDRTHRIGQKKSVYSMKLVVKDSIEEKILKLQNQKQKIFQNLVENQSASLKNLSNEDIEFLLN